MSARTVVCPHCGGRLRAPSRKITLAEAQANHERVCPGLHRQNQAKEKEKNQ